MSSGARYVVIGGGIVGLSVADRLARTRPGAQVTVIEKEDRWAAHQTGRNSGVIHSGLYYKPGSHKARMCRAGADSMTRFAVDEGVRLDHCGKLVVATTPDELPRLRALAERGAENGLKVRELDPVEAREFEPHVACLAALHVPETKIVDYKGVCAALVRRLEAAGADLRLGTKVVGLPARAAPVVETTAGEFAAEAVVNCGGLFSDRIARLGAGGRWHSARLGAGGRAADVRIVPFRGEYFELAEPARHLVRALIYPVPDPRLPFLGVHLTKMIDGGVHAGPNAVLALAREGYRWRRVSPRDLAEMAAYPGLWRLAGDYWKTGIAEVRRSLSRRRFARSLRELVPAISDKDLIRSPAGVRAQAIRRDGALVDDFLIEQDGGVVHVLNAPSPAATAAFEIAAHITDLIPA